MPSRSLASSFTLLALLILFVSLVPSAKAQGDLSQLKRLTETRFEPHFVRAADLDGDGDADVLSVSYLDGLIAWYPNLGAGQFQQQQVIAIEANETTALDTIDLDGDGDIDVLLSCAEENSVAWYENLGAGTFAARQVITTEAYGATSVDAMDLDNDGDADVLSASYWDDKIAWYENLGGGRFGPQQVIATTADGAEAVFAIDLDGDGDADVLSASSYYAPQIAWYENLGNGSFGPAQVITTAVNGVKAIYATDLDGDGDADVLSASETDNKIAWYENLGGGSFGSQQVITTAARGASAVDAIDLDGDGDADVLSASKDDDTIAWYKNLGDGTFGTQQVITTAADGAISVYAIDLDGDGDADVLSASANDDKIAWYDNLGADTFGAQQVIRPHQAIITTEADGARSVYAADLDGDGDADVLSASSGDDKIAWYENLGAGSFGSQRVITRDADGPRSVYAIDLDGDGDTDVLSASVSDGKIAWYENLGGAGVFRPASALIAVTSGARFVYAIDLDNDGDADVLSASYNDDKIAWYENLGSGHFGAQQVITTSADFALSVYAIDLDGDGDVDVLSASGNDDKIAWYANSGSGAFGEQQVITTEADAAQSVYAADLDGDGDADVLSASLYDDKIAWYENLGAGSFGSQQVISTDADGAISVYTIDLDGDGDADVLSASYDDDKLAWYENLGLGRFGPQQIITTKANSAYSVYATDLDADGDADILSASASDNKIAWYQNILSPSSGFAIQAGTVPNASGAVTCTPNPVPTGEDSTCTATANSGYVFDHWSGDCTGTEATCTLSNVTAERGVTAHFEALSYAIQTNVSPSEGGDLTCTPNPVPHGEASTCTATPASGYSFSTWSGDCTGTDPSCTLSNVTGAKSVTATFARDGYAIRTTADPSAGGRVSCTPSSVAHGGSSTCTATANSGYSFRAWSGDCSGTSASCVLNNITSAQAVTATFARQTYAIQTNADPTDGGTVNCAPNPVDHGTSSTCTATSASGFSFSAWGDDCSGTDATCTLSDVTDTRTVTGYFNVAGQPLATHAAPERYVPGGLITISNRFSAPGGEGALTLIWTPQLPAGWTVVAVEGDGVPELAASGEITFLGRLQRPLDLEFRYQVSVPSDARYPKTITAQARYRDAQSDFAALNVAPILNLDQQPIVPHDADHEQPLWQLDSTELADVLLYWRENAYHLDPTQADGYNAGPGDTDGVRHSADYQDPPWRIDSFEANRVIGYWRANAYHVDPNSDDGYAPGAQQTLSALTADVSRPTADAAPQVTQQASANSYTPGGTLTLTQTIGHAGDTPPVALLWDPTLPAGWTIVPGSASGQGAPELSASGEEILFLANTLPQPLSFSYQVRIPATASGTQRLNAALSYQRLGMSNPANVAPAALVLEAEGAAIGDCHSSAFALTAPVASGTQGYSSEVGLDVTGTVQVASNAELQLRAPRITFAPGFQVATGGRLAASAAAVTCASAAARAPAASAQRTAYASDRPASDTPASLPASPAWIAPNALPPWLQDHLTWRTINNEALSGALLDAEERWLILETAQSLSSEDDNAVSDLYRLDLLTDQLQLISATETGQAGNGPSRDPAADALGERIVFASAASDLVPGDNNDTNGTSDLFLRDLALGLTERLTQTEQVAAHPTVDAQGIALVYDQTTAAGPRQILGQALNDGAGAEVVSLSEGAEAEAAMADAHHPALSADGRFLAYLSHSADANGVPSCTLVLRDFATDLAYRQPCPRTLVEDSETARAIFSPDGDRLFWFPSGQSQPIVLENPLTKALSQP